MNRWKAAFANKVGEKFLSEIIRNNKLIIKDVKGIGISALNEKDVVRHELVQRIIKAYEKHEKKVAFKEQEKQANKSNAFKNKRGGQ